MKEARAYCPAENSGSRVLSLGFFFLFATGYSRVALRDLATLAMLCFSEDIEAN